MRGGGEGNNYRSDFLSRAARTAAIDGLSPGRGFTHLLLHSMSDRMLKLFQKHVRQARYMQKMQQCPHEHARQKPRNPKSTRHVHDLSENSQLASRGSVAFAWKIS